MVRRFCNVIIYFQIINTNTNQYENTILLIDGMTRMTNDLRYIAQYYFNEAEVGSPYISILIEIDYKFNEGCEEIIRLLRALKNQLRYNNCLCNTYNSC